MFGDSEVSTTFAAANTGVAQLVEHRSPKPGAYARSRANRVPESPPTGGKSRDKFYTFQSQRDRWAIIKR